MTLALLRQTNQNTIAWETVDATGPFTSSKPPDATHLIVGIAKSFTIETFSSSSEADDDIAAGRVSRFDSVDEMIASLRSRD